MKLLKPPTLKPGDTIGICSPSGTIAHKRDLFEQARQSFEHATGLTTVVGKYAFDKHYYSAGTPQARLADLTSFIEDPSIKGIIFSAGGDTAIDLVPLLPYEGIRENPKIFAGISDATTLLSPITAKTGLVTFLGLEFLDFATQDMRYELESLKKAWFEGTMGTIERNQDWCDLKQTPTTYKGWQTIREGVASGRLIGGNSESFIQLLGTEYELRYAESILFLETYKLPKKQIHKTLMQLKLRGFLDDLQGLIIGYCLECDNSGVVGNDQPLTEVVAEVVANYTFPVMHVGEIGHCVENFLQPLGALARMDATHQTLEITENVTV